MIECAAQASVATIVDVYYVAAWEGMDFSDRETLDAVLTLQLADGTTRALSYIDITE